MFKILKSNFDKITYFLILIALAVTFIWSILTQNWSDLIVSVITAVIIWLPKLLPDKFNIMIPQRFIVAIILFLFGSLFLGEFGDFYEKFWWWDLLLHSFSAFVFGIIGILVVLIIHRRERIKASPILLAAFAFSFAMSVGAVWEIFEFTMDQVFGANMQKSGLMDTMLDLIVDAIGALVAAAYGYYFWKLNSKSGSVANQINQVVANNVR